VEGRNGVDDMAVYLFSVVEGSSVFFFSELLDISAVWFCSMLVDERDNDGEGDLI